MLAFPGGVRIFVAVQPVDMRKQFNGLWTAVQEHSASARSAGMPPVTPLDVRLACGAAPAYRASPQSPPTLS